MSHERSCIEAELAKCDGSINCPARHHPPTCRLRRQSDREVERIVQGQEMGDFR